MIHDFPALVAFARENREGLLQIKELENAKKVLDFLMDEKMSPKEILIRATNSKFRDELFVFLVASYSRTAFSEWTTFEDAVVTSYDDWGENNFARNSLAGFFDRLYDQEVLIRRHRNILLEEVLPFLEAMDPDRHWRQKVCWYINEDGNLERAWDELRRASRGLHISDSYTPEELLRGDARYAFEASSPVIIQLVTDLFVAVSKEFNLFLDDHERQEYPLRVLTFNPSARGMLARISYKLDSVVMVPKVGAQIALLSRHFAGLRKVRRREKVLGRMRQV